MSAPSILLLGVAAVLFLAAGAVGVVPLATRLDPSPPLWGRTAQLIHAVAACCTVGVFATVLTALVALGRVKGWKLGQVPWSSVALLWAWLLGVAAVVGYYDMWAITADDAYIFFRYADNIAAGRGYVWNVSDGPVEGCTSNLWLALLSLGSWAGLPLLAFSKVLGVGLLAFGGWVLFLILNRAPADGRGATLPALCATLAALSFPSVWIAAWNGMETSLYTVLAFGQLLCFLSLAQLGRPRRVWPYSLVSLLTGLARPEGLLFAGAGIAILVLMRWRDRAFLERFALSILLCLVAPGILYMFWRTAYFGLFFPMPFYVKAGLSVPKGLDFCADFVSGNAPLLGLLAVTLALAGAAGNRRTPLWAIAGCVALSLVFYGLTQAHRLGGGYDRYMTHAMVLVRALGIFVFACALRAIPRRAQRAWGMAVAAVLVLGANYRKEVEIAAGYLWMRDMYARIHHGEFTRAVERELDGRAYSVLVRDAGQAYFLHREAIDLFGLTDPFIGRHGWLHGQKDVILDYVFHSRKPEVFLLPAWAPDGSRSAIVTDVFQDPRFARDYTLLGAVPSPPRPFAVRKYGQELNVFYMLLALRRDLSDFERLRPRLAALCPLPPGEVAATAPPAR